MLTAALRLLTVAAFVIGDCMAIICYKQHQYTSSSTTPSNGGAIMCPKSSCHAGITYNEYSSDCGDCQSFRYIGLVYGRFGCVACSTDYCNTATPSSISCYTRKSSSSNGNVIACQTGIDSCYFYSRFDSPSGESSGCGKCSLRFEPSCVTCSSSNCSVASPSSISCYRRASWEIENGTVEACNAGISTCYSMVSIGPNMFTSLTKYYGGCGDCREMSNPSCVTCNSSNCNTVTPSAITCYSRNAGGLDTSNGVPVTCHSGISTCYSNMSLPGGYSQHGGCGSCNISSDPTCVICSTSNCNTRTPSSISCYGESTYWRPICSTGISSCFSLTINTKHIGSCGNCSNHGGDCTVCTTDYCNTQTAATQTAATQTAATQTAATQTAATQTAATQTPRQSSISCYENSKDTQLACSTGVTTCYSLKSSSQNTGGCGSCVGAWTGVCTLCTTSYCNSPASSSDSGAAAVLGSKEHTAVAAGLVVVLLLMRQ